MRVLDFEELLKKRQYSFELANDEAVVQMSYFFDKDQETLLSANLCFIQMFSVTSVPPADADVETGHVDEAAEEGGRIDDIVVNNDVTEQLSQNVVEERTNEGIAWLRIDYDPSAQRGILHGASHMHVAGMPQARLLLKGVPTPRQFIEFIFAVNYPDTYRAHRLDDNGNFNDAPRMAQVNSPFLKLQCGEAFQYMTHVLVPGN
jgi:hypothetical protein